MRKADTQGVKDDFRNFVTERTAHFDRMEQALKGTTREKRDISILSETTLHSTYVAFERFISDLILSYINRDFSQYQNDLSSRIKQSVDKNFKSWAKDRISFNPVKHINVDELELIVDPENRNITFKDVELLKTRCREWVVSPLRDGIVNLSVADSRLIDTVHAIRDFIAHQSKNSKSNMNRKLASVVTGQGCPNSNLGRGVRDVDDIGAFLKSTIPGNTRRVKLYMSRLLSISANM